MKRLPKGSRLTFEIVLLSSREVGQGRVRETADLAIVQQRTNVIAGDLGALHSRETFDLMRPLEVQLWLYSVGAPPNKQASIASPSDRHLPIRRKAVDLREALHLLWRRRLRQLAAEPKLAITVGPPTEHLARRLGDARMVLSQSHSDRL